jgi:hypothetical protein
MRYRMRALTAIAGGMLMLCVGAAIVVALATEGRDLILPEATAVEIMHPLSADIHIVYRLPPQQTLQDLKAHMARHQWQRVRLTRPNCGQALFVRRIIFDLVHEQAVVDLDAAAHGTVDIYVTRSLTERLPLQPGRCWAVPVP